MKLLIIIGGLIGFLVGMFLGWATHSDWPSVIWRSCAAAYVAGLLMRWWGRTWIKCLYQANVERRQAELELLQDNTADSLESPETSQAKP